MIYLKNSIYICFSNENNLKLHLLRRDMEERSEFSEFMNKLMERNLEGFPLDDYEEDDEAELIYKPKKKFVILFDKENKTFAS